jgi:UDP-N-acetylglucosamine--N-acetylmuramyl-(pentapeptide) pyrophosphoryl-undecaprenol N-acetylglucosamine transferase
VLHITGPQYVVEVPDGDPADPPYVDEKQYPYAAADFVICRSRAMTCAELAAAGLPAACVPLPLRGGEQWLNAEPVVAASAPDADVILALHVLTAVAERRRFAS